MHLRGSLRTTWQPALILSAIAAVVFSASAAFGLAFTFTASGTAASDGRPDHGSASFLTTATSLTVELENTGGAGQIGGISSVLDGISFTLAGGPTSMTLVGATSTNGTVNCATGTCVFTAGPISDNTHFFKWGLGGSSAPTFFLRAGNGSYKPDGIVNGNVTATDGITNAQHNPFLDGPVTFTLDFSGLTSAPSVTAATFYFGTAPDTQTGVPGHNNQVPTVPEPGTLLLLGAGLGYLGRRLRATRA